MSGGALGGHRRAEAYERLARNHAVPGWLPSVTVAPSTLISPQLRAAVAAGEQGCDTDVSELSKEFAALRVVAAEQDGAGVARAERSSDR